TNRRASRQCLCRAAENRGEIFCAGRFWLLLLGGSGGVYQSRVPVRAVGADPALGGGVASDPLDGIAAHRCRRPVRVSLSTARLGYGPPIRGLALNCERWLQVGLGCLRLSSSCPVRLLHTFLSPGQRGVIAAFGYGTPHSSAGGT